MSRNWTLLPLILFLGSAGTLQAQPLDSPDVVYIDGQPCSRACQAYMNWSNRAQSARRREEREIIVAVPPEAEFERVEPVARPLAAKHAAPVARTASHAAKKVAMPNAAPPATPKAMPPAMAAVTPAKPVEDATSAIQKLESKVENANPPAPEQTVAIAPPQSDAAPAPKELASRSPAPEVKAEAKAEIVLPPPATLDVAAAPAAPAPTVAPGKASEIAKAASAPLDDPDNLVALVLAGPEINSLSDLNYKNIAITEKQSALSGRVSAALMAAGAADVYFSEAKASAIDRLINGEVQAAVVLTPRDVANLFPEVEGLRTFRVPLKAKM